MGDEARPCVGQAVTVEVMDESGSRQVFDGLVFEAEDGDPDVLVQLDQQPEADLLTPGTEVLVRFADEAGLHYFGTSVAEAHPGLRTRLRLPVPPAVQTLQRRRFLRLPIHVPVALTCLDETGQPLEVCSASTLEMGGNGAGLLADRPFTAGERVHFAFELPDWGACSGIAEVKRCAVVVLDGAARHRVALQFIQIESRAQALIFSYLLAAQRARRGVRR